MITNGISLPSVAQSPTPGIAKTLGIEVGQQVVYYPRRAYDIWNTRYSVVPYFTNGWADPYRGSAAFVFQSEPIYPEKDRFTGPDADTESTKWIEYHDFRVLRNDQEFPRAWVVHDGRALKPFDRLSPQSRVSGMQEILYAGDVFWYDPGLAVFDPRDVAWVTSTELAEIRPMLSGRRPSQRETVKVSYPSPQRAILDVTLDSAGLVVFADTDYPVWQLTIDDKPAPIHRVDGRMRGALAAAGPHRLVYSFAPRSFHIGLLLSIAGLAAWILLALHCVFRPTHSLLVSES